MAESGPQKASEPDASRHSETAEEENPAIAAFNSWGGEGSPPPPGFDWAHGFTLVHRGGAPAAGAAAYSWRRSTAAGRCSSLRRGKRQLRRGSCSPRQRSARGNLGLALCVTLSNFLPIGNWCGRRRAPRHR